MAEPIGIGTAVEVARELPWKRVAAWWRRYRRDYIEGRAVAHGLVPRKFAVVLRSYDLSVSGDGSYIIVHMIAMNMSAEAWKVREVALDAISLRGCSVPGLNITVNVGAKIGPWTTSDFSFTVTLERTARNVIRHSVGEPYNRWTPVDVPMQVLGLFRCENRAGEIRRIRQRHPRPAYGRVHIGPEPLDQNLRKIRNFCPVWPPTQRDGKQVTARTPSNLMP